MEKKHEITPIQELEEKLVVVKEQNDNAIKTGNKQKDKY
jgi:hypothetical protein